MRLAGRHLFRGGADLKSLDGTIIGDCANAKWHLEYGTGAIRNHTFNNSTLRNNA